MTPTVFRVDLYQKSNDLHASVDVISLTHDSAKAFVLRKFFVGGSFEVTRVTKLRELPDGRR